MKLAKSLLLASAISGLLSTASFADAKLVAEGKKIFMTKKSGNCIACHDVNGVKIDGPGSFGPKLTGLAYWDEKDITAAIYDIYAQRSITTSAMPAFGKNGILTDKEIKAVVAFLKTVQ